MRNPVVSSLQGWVVTFLLLLLGSTASAQNSLNSAEFADHPLLDRFPDSRIIQTEFDENVNYTFVLGRLQRSRQQVLPEMADRVRGNVTKLLYEVSQEFNGEEVYEFYREQMRSKSYRDLYSCEGRDCGSSDYWANDIFRKRILYGPERNQYYMAMLANPGVESESRISVYIITRSNRQLLAYVEVIDTGDELPPPDAIAPRGIYDLLQKDGGVILPGLSFDVSDRLHPQSDIDYLLQLFQSHPDLNVYLVGHLQGSDEVSILLQRSVQRAAALRKELVSQGVEEDRIQVQGAGPLAPLCSSGDCSQRVEMVLR